MMEELMRMMELKQQGFYCSQILLNMALQDRGESNPALIRAARALAGGLGFAGETCGALTGGACLLGLYAGKGEPDEPDDPRTDQMVQELVAWFKEEHGRNYGGIRCDDILVGEPANMKSRCPNLVITTYEKANELLAKYEVTAVDD
ncbi:MAG: C_GCAxxG_C_C family protein [Ardenticatenaceae bacterium]|nr:C_GCAxxG_C_C family protein [Ardenticatenaceae bacterium]